MNNFKIVSILSVLATVVFLVAEVVLNVNFVLNSSYLEWEVAEAGELS